MTLASPTLHPRRIPRLAGVAGLIVALAVISPALAEARHRAERRPVSHVLVPRFVRKQFADLKTLRKQILPARRTFKGWIAANPRFEEAYHHHKTPVSKIMKTGAAAMVLALAAKVAALPPALQRIAMYVGAAGAGLVSIAAVRTFTSTRQADRARVFVQAMSEGEASTIPLGALDSMGKAHRTWLLHQMADPGEVAPEIWARDPALHARIVRRLFTAGRGAADIDVRTFRDDTGARATYRGIMGER
jgi:hypothetical protein